MFSRLKPPSGVDKAIDSILLRMENEDHDSEEFLKLTALMTKLAQLKAQNAPARVSPDTVLLVLGNLAGIVLILHYEKVNVVASKALGFVMRAR